MNEHQTLLLSSMEYHAALRRRGKPDGFVYVNGEDFVLRHGQWFDIVDMPHGYRRGTPKMCFNNAMTTAVTHGLRYVEGFVAIAEAPGLPIHHGWNIDRKGRLIDVTLWNEGVAYIGVEFSLQRARDANRRKSAVLDDWRGGFQLFRSEWTGETFKHEHRRTT